jgi:hypothetical protein
VTDEKAHSDDEFAGISRRGAAFVLIVATLGHPWQALRELLAAVRHLAGRAGRLLLAPAGFIAAIVLTRRQDRPTFEDYLHSRSERDGDPETQR